MPLHVSPEIEVKTILAPSSNSAMHFRIQVLIWAFAGSRRAASSKAPLADSYSSKLNRATLSGPKAGVIQWKSQEVSHTCTCTRVAHEVQSRKTPEISPPLPVICSCIRQASWEIYAPPTLFGDVPWASRDRFLLLCLHPRQQPSIPRS